MPNRIIKESIKRSPEIDRLSWFEEVVFYRMIVTADDYGRLDGRPVVLKNDLFPTKETVTKKAIEDAVSKLVSVGLLVPYVDAESDMPFLAFRTWSEHQRLRNSKAKYPAPPDGLTVRGNSPQFAANCGKLVLARAESESESESEIESESEVSTRTRARARFTPPTVEEVSAYATEKGWMEDVFNPERFVDFYTSKGWKVGKDTMKDWRAAARGWVSRRDTPSAAPEKSNPALNYAQREYKDEDFGADFYFDYDKEYGRGTFGKEGAHA